MLVDTSGWFAFFDRDARPHQDAVTYFHAAPHRLTHSYVIAEFIPAVRGHPRALVLTFVEQLQQNPLVEVVYVDEVLHQSALVLLRSRLDKTWSLCDAVSFVLMQQCGINEALTIDHHFEQAGLVRLLDPN